MIFSPDQQAALAAIREWLDGPEDILTLGGLAGTGKTTLIREVVSWVDSCAVVAYTGKAAFVLRTKGIEHARTIHSLIYEPARVCKDCTMNVEWCEARTADEMRKLPVDRGPMCPATGSKTRFYRVPAIQHSLIIVDEASMLSQRIVDDLQSYDTKILYVGDHGQLEPIGNDPGLMREPQIRLEKIHRQAANSPIISFAHRLREGAYPAREQPCEKLQIREGIPADIHTYDAILCGYNKTRTAVNARVRKHRGFTTPFPEVGERVICLRNNSELGIFNGMQATVTEVDGSFMSIVDDVGNEIPDLDVLLAQFGAETTIGFDQLNKDERELALFDFGYAMTVHKSQGSEWQRVCVLEQIARSWSANRWRYTAATRAAEQLTWCIPAR